MEKPLRRPVAKTKAGLFGGTVEKDKGGTPWETGGEDEGGTPREKQRVKANPHGRPRANTKVGHLGRLTASWGTGQAVGTRGLSCGSWRTAGEVEQETANRTARFGGQ